jgi:hypothetical protein
VSNDGAAYTIKFEERKGYLYAFVSGERDSVNTSLCYAKEIVAECTARKFQKVLVEEDFKTQLSITELFQVASEYPSIAGALQVAFIDRQLDQHSRNMFGLTVAVNRGLHARIFQDAKEAEEWLLAEQTERRKPHDKPTAISKN